VVEEVETSKVLEELSNNNASSTDVGRKRQQRGRSGWLIVFFLLLPLLAGAALLGYQQWTLYLRLNLLATENNRLLESIQASNDRLVAIEAADGQEDSAPQTVQVAIDALRQEFDARLQQLDQVIDEVRGRTLNSPIEDDSALQLVEAEHLLRIANRHLQLTDDVATTISLLQSADQLLLDSGDSSVLQAREALASELAQLGNVEELDVDGVYLRLNALRELVDGLQIAASIGSTYQQQLEQVREQNTVTSTSEQQDSLLDSGLNFFSSIFVWREWDGSPEVVRPSQDLVTVKQTIDLMLEQSQLALLTGRPTVYEQNLQGARDLVVQHATEANQSTPQILSQLDSLMEENLAPMMPDISRSLSEVRRLNSRQPAGSDPLDQ